MEDCQAEELDEEFRRGLVAVRPYIERLVSPQDGQLCREWLERLHSWEGGRPERNRLLMELVAHVRSGLLGYPFTLAPGLQQQEAFAGPKYERVLDSYSCNSCPDSVCPESTLPSPRMESGRLLEETELGRRMSEPPSLSQWTRLISKAERKVHPLFVCDRLREAERARRTLEGKALDGYKQSLEAGLAQLGSQIKESADHNVAQLIAALSPQTQEKQLKHEIDELKNKLASERMKNQSKIKKLESVIAAKNEQLEKVDKQVKKQCSQMQQEVSHIKSEIDQVATEGQQQLRAKILSLKQDVSRLEKANKKLVAEYEQRLEECKKKGGNITISGNRGDMGQLEKTVVELEERYRKIVSDVESRAAGQRRRDLQRIHELEEQLINKENKNIGGCGMQVK